MILWLVIMIDLTYNISIPKSPGFGRHQSRDTRLIKASGGSKWGPGGRPPDKLVALRCPPPHPITAQLKLWNCCTCLLAFDFAHTLKTVIEELVSGESGIVTDMSNAQIKANCHEGERHVHPHETIP